MTSSSQFGSGSTIFVERGRITDEQHQTIDLTDSRMDSLATAIENSKTDYGDDITNWQNGQYRLDEDRLVFSGSDMKGT